MPAEELRFDITANDRGASRNIKQVGNAALETSGKLDLAAASMKLFDESTQKSGKAAATSMASMKQHAKAANLLADAENVLAGRTTKYTKLLSDQAREGEKAASSTEKLGKSAGEAAPLIGDLGGASGMGALVAAGVALSPVIATVGAGLAAFGVAAAGAAKPVLDAAQKTGGLAKNMSKLDPEQRKLAQSVLGLGQQYHAFEKALQPEVLGVFNKGIQIAGHLMRDVQPVAKATGAALDVMLSRVDKEFQSGTWQSFFAWMAAHVGPDIKQLTDLFINLLHNLPQLLEALQPVAQGLLNVGIAAAKAVGPVAKLTDAAVKSNQAQLRAAKGADNLVETWTNKYIPGAKAVNDSISWWQRHLSLAAGANDQAAKAAGNLKQVTGDLIHPLNSAAAGTGVFALNSAAAGIAAQHEATQVTILTNALKGLAGGLLTTEQDQIAWRQAQQAATQAIKANTGSLNSNKASALSARSAIIASTQAAITFAGQESNVHHNIDAASAVIRAQIRYLQDHAGKSRIATAEVDALRAALAQLHSKAITITEKGIGRFSIFGRNTTSTPALAGGAAGLFINRGTTPTADDVLVRASKGELIVPTKMVSAGLVDHLRGSIPGFAAGGLAGQTTAFGSRFESQFTAAMRSAMTSAMRAAIAVARSAVIGGAAGPGGGAPAANAALARRMMPAWGSGAEWAAWNYVAMRESGWSQFAYNPSGAFGIPQALPYTKMPKAAWPLWAGGSANPRAQIGWMIPYIAGTYGDPIGAAAHERAFNWYDRGGFLPRGLSLAYNGTPYPEQVIPHGRGAGKVQLVIRSGGSRMDDVITDIIRQAVAEHGGGDVQVALGGSY